MPVFQNDRIGARHLLGAALLALVGAVPALAQVTLAQGSGTPLAPPTRLAPPQRLVPPPPAKATTGAPAVVPAVKSIEIDPLSPIDADWAGPLSADQGGFPQELWQGTPAPFIAALMPRIPVTKSPILQDLTRRLLLSNAAPPQAGQGQGAATGGEPGAAALRIERLAASGQVDAAQSILNLLPNRGSVDALERRDVELAFLAGDQKTACDRVGEDVRRFKDVWWDRALIACQALGGDHAKATLGLDLLREQKAAKDEAFDTLVEVLGGRRGKLERLPDPSPLHLALLQSSKLAMPSDALATASPAVLRAWAASESAPMAQRLVAAERAAAFGAVPVADLRALYEKTEFTAEEQSGPVAAAAKMKGARGHALLYAAARGQKLPAARAELMRTMLGTARKDGDFIFVARLIEPLVLELRPTKDLASFAGDAVRALVATGHREEAKQWLPLVDEETAPTLYPVARLALGGDKPAWDARRAAAAVDALAKADGDAGPRRAALALALLGAFDDPVGPAEWAPLAATQPLFSLDVPGGPVWFELPRAAAAHRLGETVLLALVTAGEGDHLSTQPVRAIRAIEALRVAGLENDARAMAVEAALAGGL